MLNSGKNFALRATTKINILTLVLSEKKFLNQNKNHNPPPLQVKWSVPYGTLNYITHLISRIYTIFLAQPVFQLHLTMLYPSPIDCKRVA